jgi:hypothetical protein
LDGIYLPKQLTDWPLVEVALLLIGLTHISLLRKTSFDPLGRDQSSFRLPALNCGLKRALRSIDIRDDVPPETNFSLFEWPYKMRLEAVKTINDTTREARSRIAGLEAFIISPSAKVVFLKN